MYQLSLAFDDESIKLINNYNKLIENEINYNYLNYHQTPIHLTVASYKTISDEFYLYADKIFNKYVSNYLDIVSFGVFNRNTLYLLPVYNHYLHQLFLDINSLLDYVTISNNNRYILFNCVPHVSIARKLADNQMIKALSILNTNFKPFKVKVKSIILAKTTPYKVIKEWRI